MIFSFLQCQKTPKKYIDLLEDTADFQHMSLSSGGIFLTTMSTQNLSEWRSRHAANPGQKYLPPSYVAAVDSNPMDPTNGA